MQGRLLTASVHIERVDVICRLLRGLRRPKCPLSVKTCAYARHPQPTGVLKRRNTNLNNGVACSLSLSSCEVLGMRIGAARLRPSRRRSHCTWDCIFPSDLRARARLDDALCRRVSSGYRQHHEARYKDCTSPIMVLTYHYIPCGTSRKNIVGVPRAARYPKGQSCARIQCNVVCARTVPLGTRTASIVL